LIRFGGSIHVWNFPKRQRGLIEELSLLIHRWCATVLFAKSGDYGRLFQRAPTHVKTSCVLFPREGR
jgi:hypothetical protein